MVWGLYVYKVTITVDTVSILGAIVLKWWDLQPGDQRVINGCQDILSNFWTAQTGFVYHHLWFNEWIPVGTE